MIVGFAGYARAGKHEAAKSLDVYSFETHAFADKLRDMLWKLNPILTQDMITTVRLQDAINLYGWDGYKSTKYNNEIRRLIQTLGTDCGRELLGENVWVDSTFAAYDEAEVAPRWTIADVRFPNEAQAIKDRHGIVIWVNKPGVEAVNDHISEHALADWEFDWTVNNDGTIFELHHLIRSLIVRTYLFA